MSSMSESEVMAKLREVVSKDRPLDSYNKQKKIGQGASGSVYVARIRESATSPMARKLLQDHGLRTQVAIKQMDLRNQPRKELIVNEIIVMKDSRHPNIVNFLDAFLQEEQNELWVVMEFMEGGALTDVIDNNPSITEDQIATICFEASPSRERGRWLTCRADVQRLGTSAQAEHHSPRHQERQRSSRRPRPCQDQYVALSDGSLGRWLMVHSRLWVLRQTHRTAQQARDHGRHTILDGAPRW